MCARTVAFAIGWVLYILPSQAALPVTDTPEPQKASVDELVKRLRECPDPWDVEETNDLRRAEILQTLLPLCDYDLVTIRAAEKVIASDSLCWFTNGAKLYVFNRCLFDVPERAGRYWPCFSGWQACHDSQGYKMMWPLVKRPNGRLILKSMNSSYMGPGYQALDEFDYFRAGFPLRKKKPEWLRHRTPARADAGWRVSFTARPFPAALRSASC